MAEDPRIEEVLAAWFGEVPSRKFGFRGLQSAILRFPYWYGKLFSFLDADLALAHRFGELVELARGGELQAWEASRQGRLALIVLLDQIPRNIYRNEEAAYASDGAALRIARTALEFGDDKLVHPLARTFYYFPFMHQEDEVSQARSVELNRRNIRESSCLSACNVMSVYVSALRHRSIIRRFARYPHRNKALGRISTPQEARFLKMPFSSF